MIEIHCRVGVPPYATTCVEYSTTYGRRFNFSR